jgi:hypothetical protein
VRCYREADRATVAAGLTWYNDAHSVAVTLDPRNPHRAAGVIAALSPRIQWARNLELAAHVFATDGEATGTLGASCRAAAAIYAGADPLDVLSGPKVRAFYALIADPTDAQTVCVDRHAIDIALGVRMTCVERDAYALNRDGLYGRFARAYQRAAEVLSHTPAQVQAVTWLHWRALWSPGLRPATTLN